MKSLGVDALIFSFDSITSLLQYSIELPMLKVLLFSLAALLIHFSTASRIVYPTVSRPEFNTPIATNGFVGGPTDFSVTGNITIKLERCSPYSAEGMIVIVAIGECNRVRQYEVALQAGAVGVMFFDYERDAVGRKSRTPISDTPLEIPVVIISSADYFRINQLLLANQSVIIEMTPGVSEWHEKVGYTAWYIALNIIFGVFYIILLALVVYKFVKKVLTTGFIWNISFVYLFFQAGFCILMLIRWFDPNVTWGIFMGEIDILTDSWPSTWSFAALMLMAFFWFEVINQFADTKVRPFLSKKLQIPFWILVALILLLPPVNTILLIYATSAQVFISLLAVQFATGMVVAAFYIVVAVKAFQVVKRSKRLNAESKSHTKSLQRNQASIIVSVVIACIYPPLNFALRYNLLFTSNYYALAGLYVESVLLGTITFVQVWYMPNGSPVRSPTPVREPSTDPTSRTNTVELNNHHIAPNKTATVDAA